MRVWLRPDRIGRLGLTVPDIANAISAAEPVDARPARSAARRRRPAPNTPTPSARRGGCSTRRSSANIILRTNPDGSEVRLKDVARLELGTMLYNAVGRHDGTAVGGHRGLPDSGHQRARRSPTRSRRRWRTCRSGFPRDMEYLVSLDTTLPVSEGINEIVHTLFEAVGARHHRRVHLPAELARDADSADDRAGVARRRVHLLPAARLLDQRALAARPRARHRHRRRRCDRRRRGGDAPHRARHDAEGRDDQGDGGGVRPGHRHRPDPERGVRAGRLHGRHHRAAVPAVRDHDRALGAAVGRQRADAQSGARGAAAQAADRQEDAADAVLQRLQQGRSASRRTPTSASPASWSGRCSGAWPSSAC